jgi:hypothetical protein
MAGASGNFITAIRGIIAGLRGETGRPDGFLNEMDAEAGKVFVRALQEAVSAVGKPFRPSADGPEVLAADLEQVRQFFDPLWPAGGTPQQIAGTCRQRFNAGLKNAIDKRVAGTLEVDGVPIAWLIQTKV